MSYKHFLNPTFGSGIAAMYIYIYVCDKKKVTLLQAWASLQAGILRSLAVHGLNLSTRSGGSRTSIRQPCS